MCYDGSAPEQKLGPPAGTWERTDVEPWKVLQRALSSKGPCIGRAAWYRHLEEQMSRVTDNEAQIVQQHVERVLNNTGRFDVGHPGHFERLVAHVRPRLPGVAEDELRVVTAMCVLGRGLAVLPPTELRAHLLDRVRYVVPDSHERSQRIMECAVAYGCGKWREIQQGYGSWEQRWQGAVRALVRTLEPAVEQANRWLEPHGRGGVVGFPAHRDVWSDAWLLGLRLLCPQRPLHLKQQHALSLVYTEESHLQIAVEQKGGLRSALSGRYQQTIRPGAKAVCTITAETCLESPRSSIPLVADTKVILTAHDEEARIVVGNQRRQIRLRMGQTARFIAPGTLALWECTCGHIRCAERHRLTAWEPGQVSLWAFGASAVKGPQPTIQLGSFVQGMYYALLSQEDVLLA